MYITKVVIDNVRCFEHIELDFASGSGPRMWTLLLGDNGVGKTTVLRSIAIGLMDATGASALLPELSGEWVRGQEGEKGPAKIRIEFAPENDGSKPSWIETTITGTTESGYTQILQRTSPEDPEEFPWGSIFVCGYGAARRALASLDYSEYLSVNSCYTLFNYDSPLQNAELILRRLKDTGLDAEKILGLIDKVLMETTSFLHFSGISVSGPWGESMPFGALGDGYQSTMAWIVDLLGWAMLDERIGFNGGKNDFTGIVLLDEIEQHLHPRWQKRIVGLLHELFPNLQFVATTHSPLCGIGAASLSDEECALFLLEQQEDHVEVSQKRPPPRSQRADQVLTSYLFGLETTRSEGTVQDIERYAELTAKESRTETEEKELSQLRCQLEKDLGSAETDLQRLVERAVHEAIDTLVHETAATRKLTPEAIDFEIRRQLGELFGSEGDPHD